MAEVSRFFGIVVGMFYREHPPPHFHATYGQFRIRVNLETGEVLSGSFPGCAEQLVLEWSRLHREELLADWDLARMHRPLRRIAPLE